MQNVSLEAKQNMFCQNVLLNRHNNPYQTTPGSSGLDLSSTTSIILTPDVPVTQIPMRVASPLPEDIVRLVLGHSLLSFQGISVVSCVVNSDYTEKTEVLISPPAKTVQLIKIKKKKQPNFCFCLTTLQLGTQLLRMKGRINDLGLVIWFFG